MRIAFCKFACLSAAAIFLSACAGLPARGRIGGNIIETRVDSEVARYYLANYLSGARRAAALDERIDRVYHNAHDSLPDRNELKRISDEFSVDFAALYFADRISQRPANRNFRADFERASDFAHDALNGARLRLPSAAANYDFVFVPGYFYKQHRMTGADLAAPRASLRRAGLADYFVETIEDGPIETNADLVVAAIRARAQTGRQLIVVSVSKAGPEVALALTRLGLDEAGSVSAWVNIVGLLQGSPLADERSLRWEEAVGQADAAGVESMSTQRSRQRFSSFHIPEHVLVVNYLGIPLSGNISVLARSGFWDLRTYGPNDGLSLLPDLIVPGGVTLAEVGRDHFLLVDEVDATAVALAITIIERLEKREMIGSSF